MQKIYKFLIVLFLSFVSANVYAAENCGIARGIDPSDIHNDGAWRPGSGRQLIYDVSHVEIKDQRLYLLGWAFDKDVNNQMLGQTSTLKFILVPKGINNIYDSEARVFDQVIYATPDQGNCGFNGCNGDLSKPKYYNFSYWNCFRQGGTDKCLSSRFTVLKGGFSASIDLTTLDSKKQYDTWIYWTDGRVSYTKKLGVTKNHVASNSMGKEFDYNGKKVSILEASLASRVKMVASYARLMGKSGFWCDSVIASWGLSAKDAYFTYGAYFDVDDSEQPSACRGSNVACTNPDGNSEGSILLYKLRINKSNTWGSIPSAWGYGEWNPNSGSTAFAPASWLEVQGTLSIKVDGEEKPPEPDPGQPFISNPDSCKNSDGSDKKIYHVYYLFSSRIPPHYEPDIISNTYSRNLIADNDILNIITKNDPDGMDAIETKGEGIVTVLANQTDPNATMSIETYHKMLTSKNYDEKLLAREGDDTFYVRHNEWKHDYDSEWTSSGSSNSNIELERLKDVSVLVKNISMKRTVNSSGEVVGNGFTVQRTYNSPLIMLKNPSETVKGYDTEKYLVNKYSKYYISVLDPNYDSKRDLEKRAFLLQPAVYRWDICLKKDTQACEDDVESANCSPDDVGSVAKFHEQEKFKTCTLPDNNSGFTIIDGEETDNYCNVACKDDIDIKLPNTKHAVAGQYFTLDNYIPSITGKRSCVTDKIDYNKFDSDLKTDESTMMKAYNTYKDYEERYTEASKVKPNKVTVTENVCCSNNCTGNNAFLYIVPADSEYVSMQVLVNANINSKKVAILYKDLSAWGGSGSNSYEAKSGINFTSNVYQSKTSSLDEVMQDLIDGNDTSPEAMIIRVEDYESWKSSHPDDVSKVKQLGGVVLQSFDYYEWSLRGWSDAEKRKRDSNKDLSDFNALNGKYGSLNVRCENGSLKVDEISDNLTPVKNDFKNKADNAKNKYTETIRRYSNRINSFSKCFTWVDKATSVTVGGIISGGLPTLNNPNETINDKYTYGFDPNLYFDYDDQDQVFGKPLDYKNGNKGTKIDSTDLVTKTYYWNNGSEPNEEYSNSSSEATGSNKWGPNIVDRKLLKCTGDKCDNSNFSLNGKFYTTAYLKRTEEISYTYHLPTVYTLVPSGKVTLNTHGKPSVSLDPEAVPVSINTPAGRYNYNLKFTNISDPLRQSIATGENNLEKKFAASNALNSGDTYTCNYNVINDIYDPDDKEIKFFYRPVDTYDISHPNNNPLGYNWSDKRAAAVIEQIKKDAESINELTTGNDKFTFTLTPTVMRQIRYYNAQQSQDTKASFADFNLTCYDKTDENAYHCYSPFLTCLATAGTSAGADNEKTEIKSCQSVFGNTLNGGATFEIEENRKKLIEKQNRYDELNVGGGSS